MEYQPDLSVGSRAHRLQVLVSLWHLPFRFVNIYFVVFRHFRGSLQSLERGRTQLCTVYETKTGIWTTRLYYKTEKNNREKYTQHIESTVLHAHRWQLTPTSDRREIEWEMMADRCCQLAWKRELGLVELEFRRDEFAEDFVISLRFYYQFTEWRTLSESLWPLLELKLDFLLRKKKPDL